MTADVSSLVRVLNGVDVNDSTSAIKSTTQIITRDFLGGTYKLDAQELDLDSQVEVYDEKFFMAAEKAVFPKNEEEEAEEEDKEDMDNNSSVFNELKHHCIQLLGLLQNPKKNSPTLAQLLHLLRRSPPQSIQPLFDYTLFPLLLLFDAAVSCRSSTRSDSEEKHLSFSTSAATLQVSDIVAEGALLCLEELLKKCYFGSVDQMIVVLKKLTLGALLSPLEASEEFREGVIRCFRALLLNLPTCSDDNCSCKRIGDGPIFQSDKMFEKFPISRLSMDDPTPIECLVAFLQSEPASAAVGHWLSLLLKAADVEATRGHQGSSRLRVEAFLTLRVLVAKVGTADALAFYLPGIVSQIAKVLHASRVMISGAAGSSEALDQAVRALAEYLSIVLEDNACTTILGIPANENSDLSSSKINSLASFLEDLRNLPTKNQVQDVQVMDSALFVNENIVESGEEKDSLNSGNKTGSLRVKRTANWFGSTATHVNKLLAATFPYLCVHSSVKVRIGLLAAVQTLICKCSFTLKESRFMLLECLLLLVSDDSGEVSSDAQAFLQRMLSSGENNQLERDTADVFIRLVEKLPQVMLSDEDLLVLSHTRKLLAVTYFCGPRLISDYLLQSPVTATRFLDVFFLCFSQKSLFSGSLTKIVSTRSPSSGFVRSIAEIDAITVANHEKSESLGFQNRKYLLPFDNVQSEYELPRMPPWFVYGGGQKLYQSLSGVLRLVSLYMFADTRTEGTFSIFINILLEHVRKLVSELRKKESTEESWQSWYRRTGSGDLVRQASTAVCMLNEFVFGLSDQSIVTLDRIFSHCQQQGHNIKNNTKNREAGSLLIDCVGSILHEYLSHELWDLPLGYSPLLQQSGEDGSISSHFFHDNEMLHQVIIEGIGIFSICLGKEFSASGFLHASLYLLLENVICSNFQVKKASDTALRALSVTHNHPTVGHLVLANSDYVIDSICQQLRHLDLNPHVPNVLSSMLSYIGVADKILPLLEEPIRSVSMELEILGRHHHPNLTIFFLKAVAEIVKACKNEALTLPDKSEGHLKVIKSKIMNEEKFIRKPSDHHTLHDDDIATNSERSFDCDGQTCSEDADIQVEAWESIIFKMNDFRRYRRIVGSIAGSCLVTVTPIIASPDPAACFTALDVIEDGVSTLAKVEEAYKQEKEMKETIIEFLQTHSLHDVHDNLDAAEDETAENRLLPAMNKIWPFLVSCFQTKNQLAIRRCCQTITTTIQICGGDFFSRRFFSDGIHIWKLLTTSPFHKKPVFKETKPLQLPYRQSPTLSEDPVAESSNIKVQVAILDMISNLSSNVRSSSALESHAVFKKVAGIVVGIACSGVKGLLDASVNALKGLASIDPDLIWLLLGDVYFSKKEDLPSPPGFELPCIIEMLPPPKSSKDYLYVLYGGQSYGFHIDFASVEFVFNKLCLYLDGKEV